MVNVIYHICTNMVNNFHHLKYTHDMRMQVVLLFICRHKYKSIRAYMLKNFTLTHMLKKFFGEKI